MVQARIYKPAKSAMQSGEARYHRWVLEFFPQRPGFIDPIMGWQGSEDTLHQVRLTFQTLEEALAYAEKMNLAIQIDPARSRRIRPKSYADNFRYDKIR